MTTTVEIINLTEDPKKKEELIKQINDKMTEISNTLTSLRKVVRDASDEEMQDVSVEEMVNEVQHLCKRRFNNHHVILKTLVNSDFIIKNRKTQTIQSLLSLLNNSHDAVAMLEDEESPKWIDLTVCEFNKQLQIIVKDSAPLINSEDVEKLFDSESVIQGRKGLSLLIIKDNIESNGGELKYQVIDGHNAIVISFNNYHKALSGMQESEPVISSSDLRRKVV